MTSPANPAPINALQEEIIVNFAALGDDREAMLHYLMEVGEQLPPLAEKYRTPAYAIAGCLSTVWLVCEQKDDRLYFQADSNTAITKGLIALLLKVLSGQTIADILGADLYFMQKLQLQDLLGAQRSNGQASMVKQILRYALAHQMQQQQQ